MVLHFAQLAERVWDASWHAAVVAGVVLVFRWMMGKRLPPGWRCWLWSLVALRLVMFVAPAASWSLFGLLGGGGLERASVDRLMRGPVSEPGRWRVTVGYGPAPVVGGERALSRVEETGGAVSAGLVLALVWIVGVVGVGARGVYSRRLFLRRVGGRSFGHRLEARRNPTPQVPAWSADADVVALLEECCGTMGVGRRVEVVETSAVAGPALFGVVRPRILIPCGLCGRLSREEMRFVFLHELAHLRCHDVLAEWLIAVLTTVHWFNPAVWIAAYFYRADREVWRDAMVLRAVGREHRAGYGGTLLHLLQTAGGREGGGRLAVGMLGEKHHLKERIRMIAELRKRPGRLAVMALGVVCVVIAALVLTNPRRVERSSLATAPASKPQSVASEDTVLQAQLDRRLPEIKFNGQRLEDVVDMLRDVSGARIFVNWRALDAAGIDKDWPISARMRDVRFSKALDVVLSDAGGGRVKLGYATDGGVITISTADDLPKHLSTVVYDIHDLAVPVRDYDSDPERPLRSHPGATRPVEAPWTESQITAALIKLVRETIDPESWNRRSDPATIQERDGELVITQDAQNHRAVSQLLDQLRETRTFQISTVIRFVVFDSSALPKEDPAFAPIMSMDNPPPAPSDKVKRSPTFLTADQTAALLKFVSSERGAVAVRAAPTLKTANGQRAFIKVATSRAYVGDLKVVRDAGGKFKSYEPVVETADSGLTVDLQGTVSADRSWITVSVRPLLTKLLKLHTIPFDKVPADHPAGLAKPTIQQPEMLTTEAETTCSVPDGRTLVLSLGSDFGLLAAEDYVPREGDQIYMLVTPEMTRTPGARR